MSIGVEPSLTATLAARGSVGSSCFIVGALMLLLWYFIGTPLHGTAGIVGGALLAVSMAGAIFFVLFCGSIDRWLSREIVVLLLVALFLPIYSAIRANQYFGQPFLYGALAERHWWGVAFGPVIYYLTIYEKLSAKTLKNSLLALSWISLCSFTIVVIFFLSNADLGSKLFNLTAISNTEGRGLRVKFPLYAIVFGAIYYLARAKSEKPLLNIILSGLFVFYVLFLARGRVDIVCLGITLIFILCVSGLYRRWRLLLCVGIFYAILGNMLQVSNCAAEHGQQRQLNICPNLIDSTASGVAKVLDNERAIEPGLNARMNSLNVIVNDLKNSPELLLAGSGTVSNHWKRGFGGVMKIWFYPKELGFLGAIFVYGLVAYVAFVTYSLYFAGAVFRASTSTDSATVIALRWMLVFLLIQFVSGEPMFAPTPFYFTAFACLALVKVEAPSTALKKQETPS